MVDGISGIALVKAGLSRFGPVVFKKISKLRKINDVMSTSFYHYPAIERAMAELDIVLGSYQGVLDEKLHRFLSELLRSGVITSIAEVIVVSSDDECVRSNFVYMYTQHFDDDSGALELYGKIKGAISVSIFENFDEESLGFLAKSTARMLGEALDKLKVVENAVSVNKSKFGEDGLQKLAKGLDGVYKQIQVETNRGPKRFDLTKVYVPARLRSTQYGAKIEELFNIRIDPQVPRSSSLREIDEQSEFGYLEFRDGFRRAVVLGDPGGGKTTLCQYICSELAHANQLNLNFKDDRIGRPQNQKFPFRVVLRSYERARLNEPQLTILDYIVRDVTNICPVQENEAREMVLYTMNLGLAVLAFDGLDEILDTSKRREFVSLVEVFSNQFPLCPVLITSRYVGYNNAPMPDDFEVFALERFTENDVSNYVAKFLSVYENINKIDAEKKADKFIKQTAASAKDLRQNPLMLGLMAFLFSATGDVPTNRPQIYQECALLMFEKWDPNRGIKADIPDDFDLLNLITEISSKIYADPVLEENVSETWLRNCIQGYFNEQYEDQSKALKSTRLVLEFITGRAWVMSEFGENSYKFTHRTFLEYFYARHVCQSYETVKQLLLAIKAHVLKGEWDVISHLALQIKTYRNPQATSEAFKGLKNVLDKSGVGKTRALAALEYVAGTMEYLVGTEAETRMILSEMFEKELALSIDNKNIGFQKTFKSLGFGSIKSEYVRQCLSDIIEDKVKKGSRKEKEIILSSIDPGFIGTMSLNGGGTYEAIYEFKALIRENIKEYIVENARNDDLFSGIQLSFYQELRPDSAERQLFGAVYQMFKLAAVYGNRQYLDPIIRFVIPLDSEVDDGNLKEKKKFSDQASTFFKMVASLANNDNLDVHDTYTGPEINIYLPIGYWKNALRIANADEKAGIILCCCFIHELRGLTSVGRKTSLKLADEWLELIEQDRSNWSGALNKYPIVNEVLDRFVRGELTFFRETSA